MNPEEITAEEVYKEPFNLVQLKIKNYRVFDNSEHSISFKAGLNVILGANNSGKTAVIDALRYIFNLGNFQKKDDLIKLDEQDLFRGEHALKNEETIEFEARFKTKNSDVVGQLNDMYVGKDENGEYEFALVHRAVFKFDPILERHIYKNSSTHGGKDLDNTVPNDTLDFMKSIYLSPLRDIVTEGPRVGLEIERLIRSQAVSTAGNTRLTQIPSETKTETINKINLVTGEEYLKKISRSLSNYAMPYFKKQHDDLISFYPSNINKNLYRAMRPTFTHDSHSEDGLSLDSNGLGLNNLIYSSIVLSRDTDDENFRFFLIEEPEAHLHPQVQKTFYDQLNVIKNHQIFVTSHSPTITSEVDVNRIILIKRSSSNVRIVHLGEIYNDSTPEIRTSRRYLEKFLDVTKSQLMFSNSVIFVEGISEALLMQKFSSLMNKSLRESGVEIVILAAKDGFDHFRPLFESIEGWKCAFITDDDIDYASIHDGENAQPNITDPSPHVYEGVGTFEYELLKTAKKLDDTDADFKGRTEVLRKNFASTGYGGATSFFDDDINMSYKRMKNQATPEEWLAEVKTNGNFKKAKSEFAFNLQENITRLDMVPDYIQKAINYVASED
jgi:putative ATP-dependent endonuclease of OLD family